MIAKYRKLNIGFWRIMDPLINVLSLKVYHIILDFKPTTREDL